MHARSRPLDDSVVLADWAARTPGFSGADLSNLLNEAAILTARRQQTTIDDAAIGDALERIRDAPGVAEGPPKDHQTQRAPAGPSFGQP